MKTFKELRNPMMEAKDYHYSAYQVGNDGKPKNRENLGQAELPDYLDSVVNKYATVMIVRNDGNAVTYTDKGAGKGAKRWDIVGKEKLKPGSKLIP